MYIKQLRIENFKSLSNCSFNFKKGLNVITGDNGTGKTNVIDAIKIALDETVSQQDGLLTYGTENGSVEIKISTDEKDVNEYRILKRINKQGQIKSFHNNEVPFEKFYFVILDTNSHCHLNSQELKEYVQDLKEKSKEYQVIIATLSQEIIDNADIVFNIDKENGVTFIKNISSAE